MRTIKRLSIILTVIFILATVSITGFAEDLTEKPTEVTTESTAAEEISSTILYEDVTLETKEQEDVSITIETEDANISTKEVPTDKETVDTTTATVKVSTAPVDVEIPVTGNNSIIGVVSFGMLCLSVIAAACLKNRNKDLK